MSKSTGQRTKNILVFEDDPFYGKQMMDCAEGMDYSVTVCPTTKDFEQQAASNNFDVAIIDEHDNTVAECSKNLFEKPTLLISFKQKLSSNVSNNPHICGFVCKKRGAKYVLKQAIQYADQSS